MRFGFIGGTPRGFTLFTELLANHYRPEFCVILKEDDHENTKISGEFLDFAEKSSIPSGIKKKLEEKDYEMIKELALDFIIVCGWRTLIRPEINNYLKIGLVAAHDSLLPKYRGFAPLNWAIINGEKKTGVTLFIINDGETDSGDIILQEEVPVPENEYASDVYKRVIDATISLYLQFLGNVASGQPVKRGKQNESEATYTCKRSPEDGQINWNGPSENIYNLIRALAYPYSGAFFFHSGKKYEVRTAGLGLQNSKNFAGRIPGKIISITDNGIEVMCGKGTVLIGEIYDESAATIASANQVFKSITIKLQ
ncbi:MAG TPA: methionyl-tRNA formyltransferase [Bacteroidia bacterium]|jgi:methionyl-tRNA formyltransferase